MLIRDNSLLLCYSKRMWECSYMGMRSRTLVQEVYASLNR